MTSRAILRGPTIFILASMLTSPLGAPAFSNTPHRDMNARTLRQAEAPSITAKGKNAPIQLKAGDTIERKIAGGDTHLYRVELAAGEFIHLLLNQRGADVVETLFDPSDKEVMKVDYQNGTYGQQSLSFVAERSGLYTLKVKKLSKGAAAGFYEIKLKDIRHATERDKLRAAADRNILEAGKLIDKEDRSSLEEALHKCTAAYAFFNGSEDASDKYQGAMSLQMSGAASSLLSKMGAALGFYEQARPLYAASGDRPGEARVLDSIGVIHFARGNNDPALEAFNMALESYRASGNQEGEAFVLVHLGQMRYSMGDRKSALEYYKRALSISENIKSDIGRGFALMNIAQFHIATDNLPQALNISEMALYHYERADERRGTATVLDKIGWIFFLSGEYDEALRYYNRSLSLSRDNGDGLSEAITLNNVAWINFQLGQKHKALSEFMEALENIRQSGMRRAEAGVLRNIMIVWRAIGNTNAAIFYGKQAVNIYQEVRSQSQTLDKSLQRSFLNTNENVYRTLAELLVSSGRLNEAQQILDMLKEDEYFKYLRRQSPGTLKRTAVTAGEADAEKITTDANERITAIGRAIKELQSKGFLTDEEKKLLTQFKKQLEAERKTYLKTLEDLKEAPSGARGVEGGGSLAGVLNTESLMSSTLRDLGHGTAALYTIRGEDKYTVILFTQDVPVARTYKIKGADLDRKIMLFRQVLQDPAQDPRPLAQEMYKIMVGPVASNLKAIKAQTLMWYFDGLLRYVPVAALHDGEKYMVEQYQNVVFTPASYANLKDRSARRDWRVLGLGVTKAVGQHPALPGVAEELRGIIRRDGDTESGAGVMPGVILLDDDFNAEAMGQALLRKYQVVHVASHFDFEPGDSRMSSLLLGDGKRLPVSEVSDSLNLFSGVELLTLSACNTALGGADASGADLENLAVLAQNKGAKAVTATLWSVADSSTSLLMRRFYRLLDENPWMPKSEALRQAQLSLLRGEYSGQPLVPAPRGAEPAAVKEPPPPVVTSNMNRAAAYSHPYFWAPFILVGNWQ